MDRLRKVVRAVDERVTAQGLCDLVFDRVDRFQAGGLQYDDMAVLVMKARSAG